MSSPTPSACLELHRLPAARRLDALRQALDLLQPGECFDFVGLDDPAPLYYRCDRVRPGLATWQYLVCGPDRWIVRVCRRPSPTDAVGNS